MIVNMKLINIMSLVFVLAILLSSCTYDKDEKMNIEISPLSSIIELSTKVYDEASLCEISGFEGSIDELDSKYPIECVRYGDNTGQTYRVSYLGENSIVSITYDSAGNRLWWRKIYNTRLSLSDFDAISIGQPLNDVMDLDPSGDYLFLQTGRGDFPRVSTHCTREGYLISFTYDEANRIIGIHREYV